jgi:hypothetical protein
MSVHLHFILAIAGSEEIPTGGEYSQLSQKCTIRSANGADKIVYQNCPTKTVYIVIPVYCRHLIRLKDGNATQNVGG